MPRLIEPQDLVRTRASYRIKSSRSTPVTLVYRPICCISHPAVEHTLCTRRSPVSRPNRHDAALPLDQRAKHIVPAPFVRTMLPIAPWSGDTMHSYTAVVLESLSQCPATTAFVRTGPAQRVFARASWPRTGAVSGFRTKH